MTEATGPAQQREEREPPAEGPVVRDKRRIDPETGQVRVAPGASASASVSASAAAVSAASVEAGPAPTDAAQDPIDLVRAELLERTNDVQRVSAEYANYRRRVDRDRDVARETTLASVLSSLLPVLDDIGRAREHGELEGGFRAVAEALIATLTKLGLEAYGTAGEPFNPTVHEALIHQHDVEVTEPTAVQVLQPGYRLGERILRPARVVVADPDAQQ